MKQGADVEELERLAKQSRGAADQVDEQMRQLRKMSVGALWAGPNFDAFVVLIQGDFRVRVNGSTDRLRQAADDLFTQARDQRLTSGAGPTANGRGGAAGPILGRPSSVPSRGASMRSGSRALVLPSSAWACKSSRSPTWCPHWSRWAPCC